MYIDALPWDTTATSIDLIATDGAFNSVVEGVQATIDTSSMSPGEHIVYVVGTDSNGNEGVFSAIFLELFAGTCVNAGANSGNVCSVESDCCGARRLRSSEDTTKYLEVGGRGWKVA